MFPYYARPPLTAQPFLLHHHSALQMNKKLPVKRFCWPRSDFLPPERQSVKSADHSVIGTKLKLDWCHKSWQMQATLTLCSGCFTPGLSCPAAGMCLEGFSRSPLKLLQKQPVLGSASVLAWVWGITKQPDLESLFEEKKNHKRQKKTRTRRWHISALEDPLTG